MKLVDREIIKITDKFKKYSKYNLFLIILQFSLKIIRSFL